MLWQRPDKAIQLVVVCLVVDVCWWTFSCVLHGG
jgi:hypothetical protein